MCSNVLHFIQSRRFTKKWSNGRTKACVLQIFGFCEYTIVSRINPFCQPLSYKLRETLLILPYMLPSQDSRFSALLEERTRNMEEFDQVPSQFPSCSAAIPEARHPVTFPAREKQKRNHFQRLCGLLGFCSGAVATDGRLPESRQHCTEKEDGKELTFRIVQAQQTSTEPL